MIWAMINLSTYAYFTTVAFWFRALNGVFRRRSLVEKPTDELLFISAGEAAAMIRRGEITSARLVDAYIKRIELINVQINAVVNNNFAGARDLAQAIDVWLESLDKSSDEFNNLAEEKPLLGVPFTIKDTIFCKGFVCTAGVPARLYGALPCDDDEADAVKRLKQAGAVFLAVTNVPELGLWWETNNTVYGRTRNPYDLRRTSGGSTGGEGALLASAGTVISLGTDCAGSLRIPAVFNGVFGLKPTPKIVPTTGTLPRVLHGIMAEMAVCGPMCRYAGDLELMLKVLAGAEGEKLKLNEPVNIRKLRIFYMEGIQSPFCQSLDNEMLVALHKSVKYFEKKYDMCAYQVNFPLAHKAVELWLTSLNETEYESLPRLMSNGEYEVSCVRELLKMPIGWSQHTIAAVVTGLPRPKLSADLQGIVDSQREQLRREVTELLGDDGLLLFPAFATLAPFHCQSLLTPLDLVYTALWNLLGVPALCCPLGFSRDGRRMPVGVQVIAGPNAERLLIAAAKDLEEGFGGWKAPQGQRRLRLGLFSIVE